MTLPELREAPAERGSFGCYELPAWGERYGLLAGVTARDADFGLASTAAGSEIVDRWLGFGRAFAPGFDAVVVARQCHGADIAVHEAPGPGWHVLDATDGHITTHPGVLLTVTVADCVPVYVAQRGGRWLGILHAGWRGVARGMVESGIAAVTQRAGCLADGIVMHCGISICGACYEVGPEVITAVTGRPATGPGQLDLRVEIARRAARAGVAQVTISPWCTAHDRAAFYSHRHSHGSDGRMVAYVGRPSA